MQITTTYSFGGFIHAPVFSGKSESTIDPAVTKKTEYAVTVTYDVQRAAALRDTTEHLDAPTEPTETADTGGVGQDSVDPLPWSNDQSAEELTFGTAQDADDADALSSSADTDDEQTDTSPIVTLSSLESGAPLTGDTAQDTPESEASLLGDTGLASIGQDPLASLLGADDMAQDSADQTAQDSRLKDAELGFAAAAISSTAAAPTATLQMMV